MDYKQYLPDVVIKINADGFGKTCMFISFKVTKGITFLRHIGIPTCRLDYVQEKLFSLVFRFYAQLKPSNAV